MEITVKLVLVFAASILGGCGGSEFGTNPFQITAGGGPGTGGVQVEADSAPVGTGGASGALDDGGVVATGGATSTGGADSQDAGHATGGTSSTGGSSATGGSTDTGGVTATGGTSATASVCCAFAFVSGTTVLSCDATAPWYCAGAQTYTCAQAGQCTLGMTCYASGGPYGGTVVPCP